ncbi:hypothetical protein AB0M34_08755 [Nocardia sp. NPDC050193]
MDLLFALFVLLAFGVLCVGTVAGIIYAIVKAVKSRASGMAGVFTREVLIRGVTIPEPIIDPVTVARHPGITATPGRVVGAAEVVAAAEVAVAAVRRPSGPAGNGSSCRRYFGRRPECLMPNASRAVVSVTRSRI